MSSINFENKATFAIVVDGEVAFNWIVPKEIELMYAALQSNPTLVEVPEDLVGSVDQGWLHDETGFHPPA
jgi:hypothetical protein